MPTPFPFPRPAADQRGSAPAAADFWGERSDSLHDAVQAPDPRSEPAVDPEPAVPASAAPAIRVAVRCRDRTQRRSSGGRRSRRGAGARGPGHVIDRRWSLGRATSRVGRAAACDGIRGRGSDWGRRGPRGDSAEGATAPYIRRSSPCGAPPDGEPGRAGGRYTGGERFRQRGLGDHADRDLDGGLGFRFGVQRRWRCGGGGGSAPPAASSASGSGSGGSSSAGPTGQGAVVGPASCGC